MEEEAYQFLSCSKKLVFGSREESGVATRGVLVREDNGHRRGGDIRLANPKPQPGAREVTGPLSPLMTSLAHHDDEVHLEPNSYVVYDLMLPFLWDQKGVSLKVVEKGRL